MSTHRRAVVALLSLAATACATPQTRPIELDPREVAAEEALQRELALTDQLEQQRRLSNIAFALAHSGVDLCPDALVWAWGARLMTASQYSGPWYEAARAIGLTDTVQVVAVAQGSPAEAAGLVLGDRVLSVNDQPTRIGHSEPELLGWSQALPSEPYPGTESVRYVRAGQFGTANIRPALVCGYRATVIPGSDLNALADGRDIFVNTAMMRFTEDDELQVVIAHEFAHNAMGHIAAKKRNATIGAIIGAVADVAISSGGSNTGGFYTALGAAMGAQKFSQAFEREADYVGMYFLAHSGYPLERAPQFWRHMAQADPKSIGFASSHPTSAERFVLMRVAHDEITQKQAASLALLPEMKGESRSVPPTEGDQLAVQPYIAAQDGAPPPSAPADSPIDLAHATPDLPSSPARDLTAMVTRDATRNRRPDTDTSGLIRGAWKPVNPDPRRLNDRAARDKQLAESLGLSPRLEHWTGTVAGERPHDLPRITVRLYDNATATEEIGAVVYWHDRGACSYTLKLREEGDGWLRVDQVTESTECEPQGEIWVTVGEDIMVATWHRPDGSEWFTSELRLD